MTEEDPMCDWCRLMLTVRGQDDVALVHHGHQLIVLIDNVEVDRFGEIPTECLCGRHL